ncbi:jg17141 [Pararge aegeria aegeria]|uniref:Jg17141 protein n=1 Tax=Pararge aegeria aegeria TaxID=348720 RepID=A0A8S4RIK4_9NEOP|nr:jg17141 [Pararge aegeria aegeria]
MKNEVRINVYVWADFSASTSRVDGAGGGGWGRATGGPPRGIDCPHGAQPLYILTGVLTPASPLTMNFAQAT